MSEDNSGRRMPLFQLDPRERGRRLAPWRIKLGVATVLMAAFFVLWLILGTLGGLASPLEVFGLEGVRIASGLIAGGLLVASLVFADF